MIRDIIRSTIDDPNPDMQVVAQCIIMAERVPELVELMRPLVDPASYDLKSRKGLATRIGSSLLDSFDVASIGMESVEI